MFRPRAANKQFLTGISNLGTEWSTEYTETSQTLPNKSNRLKRGPEKKLSDRKFKQVGPNGN